MFFLSVINILSRCQVYVVLWKIQKNYYEVIHENVLRNLKLANLRGETSYIVASEKLTEDSAKLGYDTRFVPPMITKNFAEEQNIGPVTDYCLVGNIQELKNVELIIEAFIELYRQGLNAKVTFYEGTKKRLNKFKEQYEPSPNIILMGIVDKVPYSKHQCYIIRSFLLMPS